MANRVRQIYQSAALYVSPSPATGYMFAGGNVGANLIQQIPRVQSVGLQFNVSRTPVQQFGVMSAIDRIIIQPPTSTLNFSYYPIDGKAESMLGFAASGQSSFVSGLIDNTQGEKNYFIQMAPEGYDAVGFTNSGQNQVISIGNGFISNYSINLAVGQIPTSSLTVEGLNAQFDTGSWLQDTPAVNPENGQGVTGVKYSLPVAVPYTGANIASALRPGDIVLSFPALAGLGSILSGVGSVNVQSVGISIPLTRTPIQRLGSPFPFARPPQFPIEMTISIDALAADIRASKLSDVLCNDQFYDMALALKNPSCGGTGSNAMTWILKKTKLENQSYDLAVGGNAASVKMTFMAQIGAVNDLTAGAFLSGSYS